MLVNLLHVAANTNEIWGVMYKAWEPAIPVACEQMITVAQGIIDRWAQSVPFVSPKSVLAAPPLDKVSRTC